jgi:hypothetical protein
MKPKPTRLDYCQYLLVSQINYTIKRVDSLLWSDAELAVGKLIKIKVFPQITR